MLVFNKTIKNNILKTPLFYFIVITTFFEPYYIKHYTNLFDNIFDIGNFAILFLLFCFRGKKKPNLFEGFFLCICLLMMASTVFHTGISMNIWKCLKYIWPAFSMILMVEEGIESNKKQLFTGTYTAFYACMVINLITQIMFPKGMCPPECREPHYWLGHDADAALFMLAGAVFGYLSIHYRSVKLDYLIYWVICIISCIISRYLTSVFMLSAVAILSLLSLKVHYVEIFSLKNAMALWILGTLILPIGRIHRLFSNIVVNVLHKSMDLSGRTYIWDCALEAIKKSPLAGYGVLSSEEFYLLIPGGPAFSSCHNYLMELVMWAGPVLLVVFLCLVFVVSQKTDQHLDDHRIRFINIIIFGYFIGLTVSTYEMRTALYLVLALAYYSEALLQSDGEINQYTGRQHNTVSTRAGE